MQIKSNEASALAEETRKVGYCSVSLPEDGVDLVKKIGRRFQHMVRNPKLTRKPDSAINHQAYQKCLFVLQQAEIRVPELKLFVEKYFGDALRAYFNSDYYFMGVELARKLPLPEAFKNVEAFSNFWHYDGRRVAESWVCLVINLSHNDECAAFRSFDFPTSMRARREGLHGRYRDEDLPAWLREASQFNNGGPQGKCVLANVAEILHRSGEPRDGTVRDVGFIFLSSRKPWTTPEQGYCSVPLPATGFSM